MNLINIIRFGSNFNWRLAIGVQWPIYIRTLPAPLKKQKNHPLYPWYKAWRINFLRDIFSV